MWGVWWTWMVGGIVLAVLEVLAPAQIFLGFALGAAATGVLLLVGGPLSATMAGSLPLTLLIFALLSLAAWIAVRRLVGVREGQVKVWDRDINED